ncbi:hypothetical protein AQUCO_04900202v1 [Aquilegia coerulea]|uniref:Pentatricopeptide repeat-containing protein-mitochondrial domain-containing protein n=1 Tax=Aquilegia coerulea TaxID=218851 RepID=A0A2G5CKE4_AQUCA|nr:hypothetical protein AQUCO_04900202v1 [Aquilegia coerulea]
MNSILHTNQSNQLKSDSFSIFAEGISLALSRWHALQMAIDNEWGGRDSHQKLEKLIADLYSWFSQPKETDQNSLNSSDFEVKIRFLKNKLNTENLIQVLDSTKDLNSSIKIFKWVSNKKRFYHTVDTYFWVILKLGMVENVKDMEFFCNEMIKGKCPHVEEAFASLIDSFAKNHRLDEALKVLEIMNLGKIKPSIRLCNVLLRTLMEEKRDLQSILFAYKEIVKAGIIPNVETLNYLIEILCENDKMESALDQYRRMNKKGCCPNSKTFEILVCSLSPLCIDDLEHMLDETMILSFNTDIEDGSIEEVAEELMIMHEDCLQGNYDSVEKLRARLATK